MAAKQEPRLVQLGLNLISLLEVNDKEHFFEGNVLLHVFWDAKPMVPGAKYFRPWIQVHNVKSIEEVVNDGMTQWHRGELEAKVKETQNGDPNKSVNVMETRNFVGKFVSPLNLHHFPFDYQSLRITVMSNTTKDITLSHKVPRDPVTREAKPLKDASGKIITTIKCNLEADTLSEWDVLLQGGKTLAEDTTVGTSALAVVNYDFQEHDKKFSAEGAVYQRIDFYVYVKRELKNMFVSIIIPSTMLSASSLCVFSMDIVDHNGDRFGVLFTVLLTIIANQFVTQGRLPYLAYMTWLDAVLLGLQIFVYCVIVETAVASSIAATLEMTPQEVDMIALWVLLGLFGFLLFLGGASGLYLYLQRQRTLKEKEVLAAGSFDREEQRLKRLWFPEQFKTEQKANDNEIVISTKNN